MKLFYLLALLPTFAFASEEYQLQKAVGHWRTIEAPFAEDHLAITASPDGKSVVLRYCDPWFLRVRAQCKLSQEYFGQAAYLPLTDDLRTFEKPASPNPEYRMRVHPTNPNLLLRKWGKRTIQYRRIR